MTRSGDLYTLEASPMMFGALGTLDQRLVSHPGFSLFYPGLNRTELRTFARLQGADGSLPHFNGNAHTALGSAGVEYGTTGWPDLACSFLIQCYRDWRETGDTAFLEEMRPAMERAASWLIAADRDGDGIPEGGSSWDIEHYPGCFIATATVWMATLRILQDLAVRFGETADATRYGTRLALASATVESMWTGSCYLKCSDPVSGTRSDDVFVGQLAGEWIVRQLGLDPVLPEARVRTALDTLYRLNGNRDRYRLMPIQVRPDGSLPDRKYAWHAWPQYSMVFVDCLALHLGLYEEAMGSIAGFDRVVRETNRTPWATTLWHDARTGQPDFECFTGRDWYMNTPATWWVLSALSGFTPDEPESSLSLGPVIPSGRSRVRYPLVSPRFWGTVELEKTADRLAVVLRVEKVFGTRSVPLRSVRWRAPIAEARMRGETIALEARGAGTVLHLASTISLGPGESLALDLRPG